MADPNVVAYIRQNRGRFPDESIRGELLKAGCSPEAVAEAFAEASQPAAVQQPISAPDAVQAPLSRSAPPAQPAQAAAPGISPPPKSWKKPLIITVAGLALVGCVAVAALKLLSKSGGVKPKTEAEKRIQAVIEAYNPARFSSPKYISEFLPPQVEGDAGEDYVQFMAQVVEYKCGEPIEEARYAKGIRFLESGIGKKRSSILGGARDFPITARRLRTWRIMFAASNCFASRVFKDRANRLLDAGRPEEALVEARKLYGFGYHLTREWHPIAMLLGSTCMVSGSLLQAKIYSGQKNSEKRLRLALSIKDLQAQLPDGDTLSWIGKSAADPANFAKMRAILDDERGFQVHAPMLLTEAAYIWSQQEYLDGRPLPQRVSLLQFAAGHRNPRLARLGRTRLESLRYVSQELRGKSPGERRELAESLRNLLTY